MARPFPLPARIVGQPLGRLLRALRWALVVGGLLVLGVVPAARAGEGLTVAAAASLGPAFQEIGKLYEARYGEVVTLVFGSSGDLSRQIENGAPFDLFASADETWLDQEVEGGWIAREQAAVYALGRLVLLLSDHLPPFDQAGPLDAAGLARLAAPDIRYFAMANPMHAPYGRAAQEALRRAGLWEKLAPKAVYGENIRQAMQFVASGNADAGLVALSLIPAPGPRARLVDAALHAPLRQAMGVIKVSPRKEAALRFMALVRSAEGAVVLRRYGMEPVASGGTEGAR